MDAFTNPSQSPPHALPATVSRVVFAELCARLPPPPVDTPEARAESDAVAMDAAAALHPADAFEAKLAAQIVAADAQVADCQRLAVQHRNDLAVTLRCRAQATSAMREMRALLRDYRRMQAEHDKALNEMHPAAMERAGYWFKEATAPEPEPEPAPAEPTSYDDLTEAERYAVVYPDRAARIRASRGLPARLDFGPPEPEIVEALVNGTSPILRELDQRQEAVAGSASSSLKSKL
jgi:hypothetical protein